MKKIWIAGAVLCAVLSIGGFSLVSACIDDPTGMTNCAPVVEAGGEGEGETRLSFGIIENEIDFGFLAAGKSYTQSFTLENTQETEISVIKLSAEKSNIEGLPDENNLAHEWTYFVGGVKMFEMKGIETRNVRIRVVVPADAKTGTQYARVKVENTTSNETDYIDIRMTVTREDENIEFGGEISKNSIMPISLSDKANASLAVKNNGKVGFTAEYSVRATPKMGLEDWKDIYSVKKEVTPGNEVVFNAHDAEEALGYGIFTLEQKIIYVNAEGQQVEEIARRTVVNLPIWALAVVGGVIILIILLIVIVKLVKKKKGHRSGKKSKNTKEESSEETEE